MQSNCRCTVTAARHQLIEQVSPMTTYINNHGQTAVVGTSRFTVTPSRHLDWSIDKSLRCRWQTRATQRLSSAHAKYSVSHHGHQTISSTRPSCWIQISTVGVTVWPTVVRWPSEVYDTHRRTKLTTPETISRSRDMVGAHQNLNGSRDLTTPLSWMVCHPWASTYYRRPIYQT